MDLCKPPKNRTGKNPANNVGLTTFTTNERDKIFFKMDYYCGFALLICRLIINKRAFVL